jgi:lipoprotein-anchoring transpeptidase ErfK/SrfK
MTSLSLTVGAIPDHPFSIPTIDPNRINPACRRQQVAYTGPERPGTISIDTSRRFLYLVQPGRTALRYGIGVGRRGFA